MPRGRKITLHLVEGSPNGIIKAQLGNWVGLITYAPRTKLDDLASDQSIKGPGIYVLTGPDPDDPSARKVYIGESEKVFERLRQHEKNDNKSFFDHIAVINSRDESLTKGHIRYLESRLIQIAFETKRASVDNNTNPPQSPLPDADRDEMEVFLDNLKILLPVLGLNFALPRPVRSTSSIESVNNKEESPVFSVTTRERETDITVSAQAIVIGGEFVVLAGSTALKRDESRSYQNLKSRLLRNNSLRTHGDVLMFVEDVPFSSPSAAGVVIGGRNINGRTFWKLEDGTTYGEWLDARIDAETG